MNQYSENVPGRHLIKYLQTLEEHDGVVLSLRRRFTGPIPLPWNRSYEVRYSGTDRVRFSDLVPE